MDLGDQQKAFNRLVLSSNLRRPILLKDWILGQKPRLKFSLICLLRHANRDR